jgi:hypothetical protein
MKRELVELLTNLNLQHRKDTFAAGAPETVEYLRGVERQDLFNLGLTMAEQPTVLRPEGKA